MLGIFLETTIVSAVTIAEMLKHNARLNADELARLRNMAPEERIGETMPVVVVASKARMEKRHAAGQRLLRRLVEKAERQAREAREADAPPRFREWSTGMQ